MAEDPRDPFGIVGTVIADKYRVEAVVGEGGFGVVYRATHQGFDVPIAVKCLKVPAHFDAEAKARVLRELRVEGRLLHVLSQRTSTVVQALDTGSLKTESGTEVPYLVLEWLEGRTLAAELRKRRAAGQGGLSLRAALTLLEPAFTALGVAHEESIAHRDIKPENLMLVTTGKTESLKILDFGIAKILDQATTAEDARTSANAAVFTPGYGAPEQFEKSRGATGPWTDVFALALVFVETVTGRRAMRGDELVELYRVATDPVARPSFRSAGVTAPAAVDAVILKALSLEPKDRYPNAKALFDALSSAVRESGDVERDDVESTPSADAALSTTAFASKAGLAITPSKERLAVTPSTTSAQLGTSKTERAEVPAPRSRWWLPLGVAAAAVAAVYAVRALPDGSTPLAASGAAASGAASDSANARAHAPPEAETLFQEAMAAWRGGAPDSAVRTMEQAVALDRSFATAQLRLALWKFARRPDEARQHFDLATRHAQNLSPRDAELLAATQELVAAPSNPAGFAEKLGALAAKRGDDAEVYAFVASAELRLHHYDRVITAADHVIALDPNQVGPWVLKAEGQALTGDVNGQLATYGACLERMPRALECLSKQINLHAVRGQCAEMLSDAKRYVEMEPSSASANRLLGIAILSTEGPREAAMDALQKGWARRDAKDRPATEASDRASLGVLGGDFTGALDSSAKWSEAVASAPDQNAHARPALLAARIHFEVDDAKAASSRADEFLRHMGAWTEPSDGDWTLAFQRVRLLAGDLSRADFERSRTAWESKVKASWKKAGRTASAELGWTTWLTAWGAVAEETSDAADALKAAPSDTTPLDGGRYATIDYHYGKVLFLAGRAHDAIPFLERSTRTCALLTDPLTDTLAHYRLGLAYRADHRPEDARAQLEVVVRRWGDAKPRSRTAALAKKALSALEEK
jgi:serine/threonine-protein kinase